jgi:uncharacterized glyoxalase superfamily protein PhnB
MSALDRSQRRHVDDDHRARLATPPPHITPYLGVSDARRHQNFRHWRRPRLNWIVMPDGRIGHVELSIGDAVLMMADEFAEIDVLGPTSRAALFASFVIDVPDVDTTYARAVAAGATGERPPSDQYGARAGWLSDPWGHRWSISTPLAAVPGGLAERDLGTTAVPEVDLGSRAEPAAAGEVANLGYFTIGVPDVERAVTFYSAVFGWDPAGGSTDDGVTGKHRPARRPPRRRGRPVGHRLLPRHRHPGGGGPRCGLGGDTSGPQLFASGWNAGCRRPGGGLRPLAAAGLLRADEDDPGCVSTRPAGHLAPVSRFAPNVADRAGLRAPITPPLGQPFAHGPAPGATAPRRPRCAGR